MTNDKKFWPFRQNYDHVCDILRLFNVLPNFAFTTRETMVIIIYKHDIYGLPHELPNDSRIRILGNWKISGNPKPRRIIV